MSLCSKKFVKQLSYFERLRSYDRFLNGAPAGSEGDANPTGWMKAEQFLKFVKHFVSHVKPSKERPVFLLLDNHVRICQSQHSITARKTA